MTIWQTAFSIFGAGVVVLQLYRLGRWGRQMTGLKRRQEIVFTIWYSLLVVFLILPHSTSGWSMLLLVLLLGFLAYGFVLGRSSAKKGQ